MALPKITTPKYPITIPSSKKNTFFRPFLMKEQKILFMALESEDVQQMFHAICDIVRACVTDVENPETMPMFDLEYLFTKIRAKSVGEQIEVKIKCPVCEKKNEVTVDLDGVEVKFPEDLSNKIMLTDKLGLILRYPSLNDASKDLDKLSADGIVSFVCDSVETVFDENTIYTRKDFTPDELLNFIESLNAQQFENIAKFFKNLPQMTKTIDCKCTGCGNDFSVDFRGLQDFFT
jgi:hypothetical protein